MLIALVSCHGHRDGPQLTPDEHPHQVKLCSQSPTPVGQPVRIRCSAASPFGLIGPVVMWQWPDFMIDVGFRLRGPLPRRSPTDRPSGPFVRR